METAACRRIARARDFPLQKVFGLVTFGKVGRRYRIEQKFGVWMLWIVVDFVRGPDLTDFSQKHDADAGGNIPDDAEVVRDEKVRQFILALQITQKV